MSEKKRLYDYGKVASAVLIGFIAGFLFAVTSVSFGCLGAM
jgi:hypothetical protein